jgi:hypothetical protein
MGIDLSALDRTMPKAVRDFWTPRAGTVASQIRDRKAGRGVRAEATDHTSLDGFVAMVWEIITGNGIPAAD